MPRTELSEPRQTPRELEREGGRFALAGIAMGAFPLTIGVALLLSALVARRAAKVRSFA